MGIYGNRDKSQDSRIGNLEEADAALSTGDITVDADSNYITDAQVILIDKSESVLELTPGATVAVDMGGFSTFALAPVQNFTLSSPENMTVGQRGTITITQDSTGSRIITLGANYVTAANGGIVLTTTASAVDLLKYEVIALDSILLEEVLDIRSS